MGLKYHSVSQLNMFLTCEKKYFYMYISDIPKIDTQSLSTQRGSAFHSFWEGYFRGEHDWNIESYYSYHDKYVTLVEDDHRDYIEKMKPLINFYRGFFLGLKKFTRDVELKKTVPLGDFFFHARADIVSDKAILDIKTLSKTKEIISPEYKRQLASYKWAFEKEQTGLIEVCVPENISRFVKVNITDEDVEQFKKEFHMLRAAVNSNKYKCNGSNKGHCRICPCNHVCTYYLNTKRVTAGNV